MLGVALDAVAAVDFRERRRHVGGRAEEVGVGERAGELHALLVPVSPHHALDLQGGGGGMRHREDVWTVAKFSCFIFSLGKHGPNDNLINIIHLLFLWVWLDMCPSVIDPYARYCRLS